jgi:Family of unknown function (DUF6263)
MNKALIVSILIGGMCGNLSSSMMQPVAAGTVTTKQAASVPQSGKLELLSPGAEPRRELKFRPAANSKQTMMMTMGMSMDMTMGDRAMPKMQIPTVAMKIELNVQQVDPSGDIHYSFAYTDINAIADKNTEPEMLAAIQKSFKTLKGIKGNIVVGSSGQIKRKNLILPNTADPMMRQTLEQLNKSIDQISTRFPSEMVGLGGKWQVSNAIQAGGIRFNQSSTYEVVKMDNGGMTIQTKTTQSAPAQDLVLPGVGKEAKARLTSLSSNGAGTYTVRFDSLLPIDGKLSINTDSKMSLQASSKEPPTNMVNKMAIDINISAK